jgi:hypothetical protein
VFDVPADTAQNYHVEGLPWHARQDVDSYQFPADGEILFKVKGVTGLSGVARRERAAQVIDGRRVAFDWDKEIANDGQRPFDAAHSGQGRVPQSRRHVSRQRIRERVEPAFNW